MSAKSQGMKILDLERQVRDLKQKLAVATDDRDTFRREKMELWNLLHSTPKDCHDVLLYPRMDPLKEHKSEREKAMVAMSSLARSQVGPGGTMSRDQVIDCSCLLFAMAYEYEVDLIEEANKRMTFAKNLKAVIS